MCGRFTLRASKAELQQIFLFETSPDTPKLTRRYNIAPTQDIPVVRSDGDGKRELTLLRWGLIPGWIKQPSKSNPMINARGETAAEKPFFRSAFKKRRCIVLADGFIEWKKVTGQKHKQPMHIHLPDSYPFAFAGLYERWDRGDEPIESCTIITTEANDFMRAIHHRMPVILTPDSLADWLDPGVDDKELLTQLLAPYAGGDLEADPISKAVNSPRNEGPECLRPPA